MSVASEANQVANPVQCPAPFTQYSFIAPPETVTIGAGEKLVAVSSAALGSTASGGAQGLDITLCIQNSTPGSPIQFIIDGMFGLTVSQNQRTVFSVNGSATGLTAGNYTVGLCGCSNADASKWNNNDFGQTTAFVTK